MKRITSIFLLLLILASAVYVERTNRQLVQERQQYGITQADPLVNAPPLVVFTTIALGGFRGIIADVLWMRSTRLQAEGKYFELVQLADWITKLEPRFTDVWAYHAWNLTYNISVLFTDFSDRWRWVRHGITLLRDEGMVYNPGEPRLIYELGWFFQHKLAGDTDDAHMYYKQAWANEMQAVFGSGRPDYVKLLRDPIRLDYLTRTYKLDPVRMQKIETRYGPLDWRLPQAHAIYWAVKSKEVGTGPDIVFAQRMIYQSMTDAFRRGRLHYGDEGGMFIPSPHLDLLPYVLSAYDDAISNPDFRGATEVGYQHFLSEAVIVMYMYNRIEQAEELLTKLKALKPELAADTDVETFVYEAHTAKGNLLSQDEAYASIESALYQAAQWDKAGDHTRATGYEQLAQLVWDQFMAPRLDNEALRERTGLPPLEEIRKQAIQRLSEELHEP